jgi:hypothetical protein
VVLLRQLPAEVLQLMVVTDLLARCESLEFIEMLKFFAEALYQCTFADAPAPAADDQTRFRQTCRAAQLRKLYFAADERVSICSNGGHAAIITANRHFVNLQ